MFRALTESFRDLTAAVREHGAKLDKVLGSGTLQDRVQALEGSQEIWEAKVEAEFIRIDSRARAARSAEERVRSAQARLDLEEEAAQEIHAPESLEEGVFPVRDVVEVDPSQIVIRRKFGVA